MKYLTVKQAAAKLDKVKTSITRMCNEGRLPGALKKNGSWQIPESAHPDLRGSLAASVKTDPDELFKVPLPKREQATQRLGILMQMEKYIAGYLAHGGGRKDAIKCFASLQGIGARTLERWSKQYRDQGIMGLIDARGGRTDDDSISEQAWAKFLEMWLTDRKLSVTVCYRNLIYFSESQQLGWQIPSERSMYRLIKERVPLPAQVLHREGEEIYNAKCAPYILMDREAIEPGSVWIGDHHQCNCWIRHKGQWIRPWLTAWEDMRSRALVGYCVTANPNQTTIMLAFRKGCQDYGPPESVKIDNGKDYDSQMWTGETKKQRQSRRSKKDGKLSQEECKAITGLYAMMNIGVSFSIAYHPQSKAVERWFDTFDCQLIKAYPTYCGKNNTVRPTGLTEYLKTEKAIAQADDLESFANKVNRWFKVYNATGHSANNGQSPDAVMATRQSRRVVTDNQLDLLCQVWSGELTIGKNGVKYKGFWYGQYNTDLLCRQGTKVRISYNPDDMAVVRIYDAATWEFVANAEQARLVGYGDKVNENDLRDAMKQKRKALKFMKEYNPNRRAANMDLTDLTIEAAEHAVSKAAEQSAQIEDQPQKQPTLKPVQTPLDNAVTDVKRKEKQRQLRKAVGSNNAPAFDMDLDSLAQDTGGQFALDLDLSELGSEEVKPLKLFDLNDGNT